MWYFYRVRVNKPEAFFSFKPIPWMMDLSFVRRLVVFQSQHAQSSTVARGIRSQACYVHREQKTTLD